MVVNLFPPECLIESGEEEWPLKTNILDYLLLDTIPVNMTMHIGSLQDRQQKKHVNHSYVVMSIRTVEETE